MNNIIIIFQIIIALSLLNVWVLRYKKETNWRGGSAKNMVEEFKTYGLPKWFMFFVGFLKIVIAILLLVGIWIPLLIKPVSALLVVLMLGAVVMHIKVKDTYTKSLPALFLLLCSIGIVLFA